MTSSQSDRRLSRTEAAPLPPCDRRAVIVCASVGMGVRESQPVPGWGFGSVGVTDTFALRRRTLNVERITLNVERITLNVPTFNAQTQQRANA